MARKRRNKGGTPNGVAAGVSPRPVPKLQTVAKTLQRQKTDTSSPVERMRLLRRIAIEAPALLNSKLKAYPQGGDRGVRGDKGGSPPRAPGYARSWRALEERTQREPASPTVRDLDKPTCKERPKSNASKGGGSRNFVPWCR